MENYYKSENNRGERGKLTYDAIWLKIDLKSYSDVYL